MEPNIAQVNRRRQQATGSALHLINIVVALTASVLPAWATSYECVAPSGAIIYTDSPEPTEKCNAIELLMAAPPKPGANAPSTRNSDQPGWQPSPPAMMPDGDAAVEEPYVQPDELAPENLPPTHMRPTD